MELYDGHSGHWGSYEAVDHGYDNERLARRQLTRAGALRGFGQLDSINPQHLMILTQFLTATVIQGGLLMLPSDVVDAFVNSVGVLTELETKGVQLAGGAQAGTPIPRSLPGGNWIQEAVANGLVVLIGSQLKSGAEMALAATPEQLLLNATPTSDYKGVIVDGPADVIAAAQAMASMQPIPTPTIPTIPTGPAPLPPPGVEDQPEAPMAPAPLPGEEGPVAASEGLPSWVIPVGLGLLAIGAVAIIVK